MTVHIVDWACCESHLKPHQLKHGDKLELTEAELSSLVFKLFNSGLNVMLKHTGNDVGLCVDTKSFQQR